MVGSHKSRIRPNLQRGRAHQSSAANAARPATRAFLEVSVTKGASKSAVSAQVRASATHSLALTLDHGLVAMGVAAAVASASFAGFMLTRDNSHPMFGGIEHLMIFAQPIGGHRPPVMERSHKPPVDYRATGSIEPHLLSNVAAGEPPRVEASPGSPTEYILRFGHRGDVVVEGPKGSFAAAPGVVLPNAGRILSIQNRNGRWVVTTEHGMISEPGL